MILIRTIFVLVVLGNAIPINAMDCIGEIFDAYHFSRENMQKITAHAAHCTYHRINNNEDSDVSYREEESHDYKAPGWTIKLEELDYFGKTSKAIILIKDKGLPISKALESFIKGPTVADCWAVQLIAKLKALEAALGKNNLDTLFTIYEDWLNGNLVTFSAKGQTIIEAIAFNVKNNLEARNEKGAFSYFANVPQYPEKHPNGFSSGQNVVCVGTKEGVPAFMMFNKKFKKLQTEDQIRKYLYEQLHTPRTELEQRWCPSVFVPFIDNIIEIYRNPDFFNRKTDEFSKQFGIFLISSEEIQSKFFCRNSFKNAFALDSKEQLVQMFTFLRDFKK